MDMFPVFCALLGFVLIGPSDANVVTLNLTSSRGGERKNFYATCNGPCGQVNVTALSGNPQLFLAKNSIPFLQWSGGFSGSVGCKNCLKEVNLVSFTNSSSFGLSVLTNKSSDIVKVEAANLKDIKERNYPSKILNLTPSSVGERKNFNVTCDGPCSQVYLIGVSGKPRLFLAKKVIPFLQWSGGFSGSVGCKNCLKEVNLVSFTDSSSFGLSVLTTTSSDIVKVEAANLKDIKERNYPSKILNLTSSKGWERKNFYATCDGPCSQVNVIGVSGNPRLFLAKNVIPFLQWSGNKYQGSVGCKNCLKEVNLVSFTNSSSFGLSVLTTKLSDIVKVEAANLKDIKERNYPSKTVNLGKSTHLKDKTVKFTCHGPCKQVFVNVTASTKWVDWWVTKTEPIRGYGSGGVCGSNCVCLKAFQNRRSKDNTCQFRSLDISSFYVLVRGWGTLENITVTVEASNLDLGLDKSTKIPLQSTKIPLKSTKIPLKSTSIPLPSKVLQLGSGIKGERWNFNATCNGPCKGVGANVTASSGFPHLYGAKDSLPHPGYCDNCFCRVNNVCQNTSFQGSSSFAISVVAYTDIENATLTVEAHNLDKITKITLPSKRLNLGSSKRGNRRNFIVTCNGPCEQVSAYVRAKSGNPWLFGAENPLPHLDEDIRCKNCFCASVVSWLLNICQYFSFEDSSSFTLSVVAETDYEDAFLVVEAINFKNLEEIVLPFQILNVVSSILGERKAFYITCHGPCSQVDVRALSGNPQLYLAKNSIPQLEGRGGSLQCNNCFKERHFFSFEDSSSFALSATAPKSNATVKVEAANLKDIHEYTEKTFPSKTVDIGYLAEWGVKYYNFTCRGLCKQVSVEVTISSGLAFWFASKDVLPWANSGGVCKNCFCTKTFSVNRCQSINLPDSSTFGVKIMAWDDMYNAKLIVKASNLKGGKEIIFS